MLGSRQTEPFTPITNGIASAMVGELMNSKAHKMDIARLEVVARKQNAAIGLANQRTSDHARLTFSVMFPYGFILLVVGLASCTPFGLNPLADSGAADADTDADTVPDAAADAGKKPPGLSPPDAGEPTNPDTACKKQTGREQCNTCCTGNHLNGAAAYQTALIACACNGTADAGDGPCASICADTVCSASSTEPDEACQTCIQGLMTSDGLCVRPTSEACQAEPDCMNLQGCYSTCPP